MLYMCDGPSVEIEAGSSEGSRHKIEDRGTDLESSPSPLGTVSSSSSTAVAEVDTEDTESLCAGTLLRPQSRGFSSDCSQAGRHCNHDATLGGSMRTTMLGAEHADSKVFAYLKVEKKMVP